MTTLSASQLANHSRISDSYFTTITNPPFDPRSYPTDPNYNVQQGLLIRDSSIGGSLTTTAGSTAILPTDVPAKVKLRFRYNPSDYTVNYQPTDSLIMSSNTTAAGSGTASAATLLGGSTTTCGLSLMFDRTYETSNTPGSPDSHISGVSVDIDVFTQLLGIPKNGDGFPLYRPMQLYLGGVNSLAFYGVISGSSVVYTHFDKNMVPLRAVITIGMTQWIDGSPSTVPGTPTKTTGTYSAPRLGTAPGVGQYIVPTLPQTSGTR